jgi:membrane protein YdbS with pleckstrin-like domain
MTGNPLTGYPVRDRIALAAGLVCPFLVALVLVPFRTDLSSTNAALILVVVVVAVAAVGSRPAGAV